MHALAQHERQVKVWKYTLPKWYKGPVSAEPNWSVDTIQSPSSLFGETAAKKLREANLS